MARAGRRGARAGAITRRGPCVELPSGDHVLRRPRLCFDGDARSDDDEWHVPRPRELVPCAWPLVRPLRREQIQPASGSGLLGVLRGEGRRGDRPRHSHLALGVNLRHHVALLVLVRRFGPDVDNEDRDGILDGLGPALPGEAAAAGRRRRPGALGADGLLVSARARAPLCLAPRLLRVWRRARGRIRLRPCACGAICARPPWCRGPRCTTRVRHVRRGQRPWPRRPPPPPLVWSRSLRFTRPLVQRVCAAPRSRAYLRTTQTCWSALWVHSPIRYRARVAPQERAVQFLQPRHHLRTPYQYR
mmetsp:Transcript_39728/g.110344  ORF Transcript_39728/g.110344 Transcript_39728/m.110344 type:complete len:303 (+) Transcript_39728:304-1212(+)